MTVLVGAVILAAFGHLGMGGVSDSGLRGRECWNAAQLRPEEWL